VPGTRCSAPFSGTASHSWVGERRASRLAAVRLEQHISADELEDFVVAPSAADGFFSQPGGLLARSDRRAIRFGGGLSAEERAWLHGAICHTFVTLAWGYRGSQR
jgi:hypothetical protein